MGEGVTVCMLWCVAVAEYRNCGLLELRCGGVVVCGSCIMVESVCEGVMVIHCVFSVFCLFRVFCMFCE